MFLAKKSFVCERERSIGGNSAHQFEVRGRGEMPLAFSQSSVQINLRSAPRQPLTHRVNGNLKVLCLTLQ